MPSWDELLSQFAGLPTDYHRSQWLPQKQTAALQEVGKIRGNRHVVSFMSGFLQRPDAPPPHVSIGAEDLNGLMSVIYGMEWNRGLTILLHTPGGSITATQTIVEYLRSKFDDIEVIVPTYAMSAGTMVSLAADRVVMGRQSQLGPIDPQLGGSFSAQSVVDQFDAAKLAILGGTDSDGTEVEGDLDAAHLWAPLLQSMGPALLQEARNALGYGELMVKQWLEGFMMKDDSTGATRAAHYFSDAGTHKNHGRRISREEARSQGLLIEDLEDSQDLQEAVLTAYHLQTIAFEHSEATKAFMSDHGRAWVKNRPRSAN